ncbi:MAG: hypothetical protein ACFWTN_08180 [Clostridium sp.]
MKYDVLVIGAGAAGMMAAGTAAQRGLRVCLLEKNQKPGRKIGITGKGRCNLTNNCSVPDFIASVPTNGRFLFSAASRFSPHDTMAFFEGLGLPLKTERGNRVFPQSDRASDVVKTLAGFVASSGVKMVTGEAKQLLFSEGHARGAKLKDGREILAENVVVCCGGKSYPATGSTGDGYLFAKQAGHTIVPLRPSLVPLVARETDCGDMMGLSLKNISICVVDTITNKTIYQDFGELLFTHFGLSGPVILSASAHMRNMAPGRYQVIIDLKPALSPEKLDARLIRVFKENQNRDFSNSLSSLLPKAMIPVVVRRSCIQPHTKCNLITRKQRHEFAALLKSFTITIESFRPIQEAVVTSGGVSVKEVDPKTMQSKLVKGLYFAGEILDVDAYTGGYNLQIAFSTGRLAGNSVKMQGGRYMIAVAIDGPAGAGKSTVARKAAKTLGFIYVDTGALYRAIGLHMLQNNISPADKELVCSELCNIQVKLTFQNGEQKVLLCGRDVTSKIRTEEVSAAASKVSAIPEVRKFLFSMQRDIAQQQNVVMDGRDIGTVVLPNAQVKIFLTASPEERAKRRYQELLQKKCNVEYADVLTDMIQRDYNDSHRTVAPLVAAQDAITIDTTGMTLEQSVARVVEVIRQNLRNLNEKR